MGRIRKSTMFEKFKEYNPILAGRVVEYERAGSNSIKLTLRDGAVLLYHYLMNSYRRLVEYEFTEEGCRTEVSYRLAELMADNGVDQKELAEISGLSEATISNYINRKTTPNLHAARVLARALNCSVNDLLD